MTIWLEVKLPNSKPFLISNVYRPPSSKVQWLNDFTETTDKALANEKECIILGDFNYDLLTDTPQSKAWLDMMESVDFTQLVKSPTRISPVSAILIDHAFSNCP